MKILEICPFTAGICGVWTRVLQESLEFQNRGNSVLVLSTNIEKGTSNIASKSEKIQGIQVKRFKARSSLFSKNVYSFNFTEAFKNYAPDIVITHLLHPHSFIALKLSKKYKIPCFLVTHAPFNVRREMPLRILTSIYTSFKIKPLINQFTKIIAITKWEMPYLKKLGIKKDKIVYIPNGIPEDFFKQSKVKEQKKVLFLGRIAPVKNLELLIKAAEKFPDIQFSVVGKAEEEYLIKLKNLVKKRGIKNIKFFKPVYDLREKISLIDAHRVFVLPSKREAMPQVILEALSRGKIVVSSETEGSKELITPGSNGFIFPLDKEEEFFNFIAKSFKPLSGMQRRGIQTAKKFAWSNLIKSYLTFIKK